MRVLAVLLSLLLGAWGLSPQDWESDTRVQINTQRTPDVRYGPCVDRFAEDWAKRIAATGTIVHRDQGVILRRCNGARVGEIIARGYGSPRETAAAWMESPTHRAVLTNPDYRRIGIGAAQDNQGRWVVVANFIRH